MGWISSFVPKLFKKTIPLSLFTVTSSVFPAGLHYRVAQHGPDQSVYTLLRTCRHCGARGAWSAQDGTSASGPASAATSRERGPCEHRKKQFGVLGIFGNTNAMLIYINIWAKCCMWSWAWFMDAQTFAIKFTLWSQLGSDYRVKFMAKVWAVINQAQDHPRP